MNIRTPLGPALGLALTFICAAGANAAELHVAAAVNVQKIFAG